MPTVECKDCKKLVSPSAETCPYCGAKYPASYIPSKVIIHRIPSFYAMTVKMIVYVDGEKKGN